MKRVVLERLLLSTLVLAVAGISGDSAQHRSSPQRHWEETETIWRGRYTNCKYGYYVMLSSGVIAYGSHSPPRTTASWSPCLTWERHPRHRSATHDSCGTSISARSQAW